MDPLAGWTVAVTAERRAGEQVGLLQSRGANVLLAPTVRAERVGDAGLRVVTSALVERPARHLGGVDGRRGPGLDRHRLVVGPRAGPAAHHAGRHGGGPGRVDGRRPRRRGLRRRLAGRGRHAVASCSTTCAAGAWPGGGWPSSPTAATWPGSSQALRDLGADVVEVPVYRLGAPDLDAGLARLRDAAERRELDAITFTSAGGGPEPGVAGGPDLVERLSAAGVVCACVGPVTAEAARDAGLPRVVTAEPSRLGSMIGLLAEHLGARARIFEMAGQIVRVQGARIAIGEREVRLTPRERTLLEAMVAAGGAVLSKRTLSQLAWARR